MNPLAPWAAALAVLAAVWLHGHQTGKDRERSRWEARTAALVAQRNIAQARAAGQAQIIAQAAQDRARLLAELEDADRASPTADSPSLGVDAVRRLRAAR